MADVQQPCSLSCRCSTQVAAEDLAALPVAPEARELAAAFTAIINAALAPGLEQRPTLDCLLTWLRCVHAGGGIDDVEEWDYHEQPPNLEEELRDEWDGSEAHAASGHSSDASSNCTDSQFGGEGDRVDVRSGHAESADHDGAGSQSDEAGSMYDDD